MEDQLDGLAQDCGNSTADCVSSGVTTVLH